MSAINPIDMQQPPREVLSACFKSLNGGLPIHGGWGYSHNDACIIDKDDPLVNASLPFNGVAVEYVFVEKRIYIEMIIHRPRGDGFSGIKWKLHSQNLITESERKFDQLVFEITAIADKYWEILKTEFEGEYDYHHPDFDIVLHDKKWGEKSSFN